MNSGPTAPPSHSTGRHIRPPADFSTESIKQWIGQLPLSDVNAACEAIHGLLRALNTTDGLECLERQRIVEQIRPPTVSLVAMSSEQHLPKTTLFPLPESQHKYTQQNVDVCLELANAYRRVVTCGAFFSDKVTSEAQRAQTVYRALQAYGLALLRSLERYESPPDGFWQEVYAFYRFAEGHQLHALSVPMPEVEGATIESQFKQMLLLTLSSYQHHLPDEVRQFYAALMLIGKDAELMDAPEQNGEAAAFYFDMGSDNAARLMKRAKSTQQGQRRYLFTARLLKSAQQRLAERFKLRHEVITSLLEALGGVEKRRFIRTPTSGKRRFIVGLPQLIEKLSGTAPPNLALSDPALPEPDSFGEDVEEVEIVLGEVNEPGADEIWSRSGNYRGSKKHAAKRAQGTVPAYPPHIELTGALLNSSAGGYCMSWLNSQIPAARIGELIGIYEDEQRLHVGVIRWLHHTTKADLVIGVELLSPVVEAVDLETGSPGDGPQRGLYFSANPKLGQPDSLLCEPGLFKVGQPLALRGKRDWLLFRLEKLLGSTLSFQLFSLSQVGEEAYEDPPADTAPTPPEDP